jgi:hypothetical protein
MEIPINNNLFSVHSRRGICVYPFEENFGNVFEGTNMQQNKIQVPRKN